MYPQRKGKPIENAKHQIPDQARPEKVETLVAEGKKEEAKAALPEAISLLDKIAAAGVIKQNNADRKKAHLEKIVAAL